MPKEKRISLIKIYYHVCTTPGMPNHVVASSSDALQVLSRSKKKLSIDDIRLPWKPIFKILSKDLFLTRRQFEIRRVVTRKSEGMECTHEWRGNSQTSWYMGYIAENVRRFFHPAAIDEMLSTFLPHMNSNSLNASAQ